MTELITESPFLLFLLFFLACLLIGLAYEVLFRLPNRIIRGMNIRKNGWPPAHCDADGDFRKDKDDE